MVATSRFVLRGALAAAVAVLASSHSGTIAVAQQVAVNTEDQAASEPSPDEERPGEANARQIVPFHTSEAPGTIIVDTGERYLYLVQPEGWLSVTVSASDVLVFNGRASSGCHRNRSGRTGACPRR
jgi:lipoprotein-anchoring transpeptidase ErfK/SrfK